ncbi:MAG: hypothetical protein GKS01_07410 [Alphaproteobacteria bacterium]|nr:hypothetical protein [Alphaproteobacteria bacterium]
MSAPNADITPESLAADAAAVAAQLGVSRLPLERFRVETGISLNQIYKHYDSWGALCRAAGLVPTSPTARLADEKILADIRDGFIATGGITPWHQLRHLVPWGHNIPRRRWGSWGGTLSAFRDWVVVHDPDFPYLAALEAQIQRREKRRQRQAEVPLPPWPALGGRVCGEALNIGAGEDGGGGVAAARGCDVSMLHAPVNEQGVVMLFGMMAAALGYVVDSVTAAFPDCTGKRLVREAEGGQPPRWEAVRIEFEYRSRSFHYHRHDAAQCDVIICWEDDWPDCPLEVLALKEALAGLKGLELRGAR